MVTFSGWNSLHLAVRYGQPDTITTLLEHGIDINAHNRGWTALHLAALNGHTDIASILLNKGAGTEMANSDGKTALDIAREEKHERIVAIILEMEFQAVDGCGGGAEGGVPRLPTPPPSPPSAPPMELSPEMASSSSNTADFRRWRQGLKAELDNVVVEDSDSPASPPLPEAGSGTESGESSLEVQLTWKSLEEETKELMSQLSKLRLQEVNQVKNNMLKVREEAVKNLARVDKQKELLAKRIEELNNSIPGLEEQTVRRKERLLDSLSDIDVLLANAL